MNHIHRLDLLRNHLDAVPAASSATTGAPFKRCLIANRGEIAIVRAVLHTLTPLCAVTGTHTLC